jgi:hypothetical protein
MDDTRDKQRLRTDRQAIGVARARARYILRLSESLLRGSHYTHDRDLINEIRTAALEIEHGDGCHG